MKFELLVRIPAIREKNYGFLWKENISKQHFYERCEYTYYCVPNIEVIWCIANKKAS